MTNCNAVLARNAENAPAGVGSYSQTVAFSHYNHLSAKLPIDPASSQEVAGGAKEQAEQCLASLKAIVESIDHSLEGVVKVNIFLKNIADIAAVNEVYPTFFPGGVPARRTVGVSALSGVSQVLPDLG